MRQQNTFEYYSTFAPVSDAFTADDLAETPVDSDDSFQTLLFVDSGYKIFSINTTTKPINLNQK